MTYDGKITRLFVDGKGLGGSLADVPVAWGNTKYLLGASPRTDRNFHFKGMIKEIRISKTLRYLAAFKPQLRFAADKDTVALYHFDEGSGDVLKDSSGKGNHGAIVEAHWVTADGTPIAPPSPWERKAAHWVLSLGGAVQINDGNMDIKALADLPNEPFRLTAVHLMGNKHVNDAGLSHLKDCPNLTHLDLGLCSEVTDAGIAHLSGARKLIILNLFGTKITDAGLQVFENCKDLSILWLDNTGIGDAGMAHFQNCKKLTQLHCNQTRITDDAMAQVRQFGELTHAGFSGTALTDAGLRMLKDCKSLTFLFVTRTKVTAAGVRELKTSLPNCRIEGDMK